MPQSYSWANITFDVFKNFFGIMECGIFYVVMDWILTRSVVAHHFGSIWVVSRILPVKMLDPIRFSAIWGSLP